MRGKRILIVDDSATSRMIIQRCCDIAGLHEATYFEAEDGLAAIAVLQEHPIELILSDLKMPKMDGTTFIKKVKHNEATRDIPVVVISSMANDVTDADLLAAGVAAVIRKPISPEKIIGALGMEP